MRERSKRYLKHYSKALYHVSSSVLFWGAIISVVYINVLYTNAYGNDDTFDI